jgi:hypothetical protein
MPKTILVVGLGQSWANFRRQLLAATKGVRGRNVTIIERGGQDIQVDETRYVFCHVQSVDQQAQGIHADGIFLLDRVTIQYPQMDVLRAVNRGHVSEVNSQDTIVLGGTA